VSAISKVLVVLVSFMAVLLVAITVPFVYNTQNYAQELEQQKKVVELARASAQQAQNDIKNLQEQQSSMVEELQAQTRQLTGEITGLSSDLAAARAEVRDLQAANAADKADVKRLIASVGQYAQLTQGLKAQRDELLDERLENKTALIDLRDRNNVLASQKNTLERQYELLQEDLTAAKERVADLESTIATTAVATADTTGDEATFEPAIPISGSVTNVSTSGDERFVQVNVGSNDGVARNMKFLVHRGGEYLGTLIITRVDSNAAAGRIELAQGDISVNDDVLAGGS